MTAITDRRNHRKRDTILIAVQGLTAMLAVAALVMVVLNANSQAVARRTEFCRDLRTLVTVITPKPRQGELKRFLKLTGLNDCYTYARRNIK